MPPDRDEINRLFAQWAQKNEAIEARQVIQNLAPNPVLDELPDEAHKVLSESLTDESEVDTQEENNSVSSLPQADDDTASQADSDTTTTRRQSFTPDTEIIDAGIQTGIESVDASTQTDIKIVDASTQTANPTSLDDEVKILRDSLIHPESEVSGASYDNQFETEDSHLSKRPRITGEDPAGFQISASLAGCYEHSFASTFFSDKHGSR